MSIHERKNNLTGTYVLILHLEKQVKKNVGVLGVFPFRRGYYLYIGSAFGPGGLQARIDHHRHKAARPRWHIDYLRPWLNLIEIWYTYDPARREHQWVQILANTKGTSVPLVGFGSSDCRCKAHLFFRNTRPSIKTFRKKIHAHIKNHDKIFYEVKNY